MSISVKANGNSVHALNVPKSEGVAIMCSFNIGNSSASLSDITYSTKTMRDSSDISDGLYFALLFKAYYEIVSARFDAPEVHAKCNVTSVTYSLGSGRGHVGISCSKKGSAIKKVLKLMVKGAKCGPIVKEAKRGAELSSGIKLKSDILKSFCETMCDAMTNMDVMVAGKVSAKNKEDVTKLGKHVLAFGSDAKVKGGSRVSLKGNGLFLTPKCDQLSLYVKWAVLSVTLANAHIDAETDKLAIDSDESTVKDALKSGNAANAAKKIAALTARQQSGLLVMLAAQHAVGDALKMADVKPSELTESNVNSMLKL